MLRMIGMSKGVASKQANSYRMIREWQKGIGVPRSWYEYEVCKVTKRELDKMVRIQNKAGRLGLGANSFVGVEELRGEMG